MVIIMKRGRPSKRHKIEAAILECLAELNTYISVNAIVKYLKKKMEESVSWNTVKKYLDELVSLGKVEVVQLPHSKKESAEGLKVYRLKK